MGGDGVEGFQVARVTGGRGVVEFMEEALPDVDVVGDAHAVLEEPQAVAVLKVGRSLAVRRGVELIGRVR